MAAITVRPTEVIRSPFTDPGEAPIQPRFAAGAERTLELDLALAGAVAHVVDVDALDGAPLLGTEPCVPAFEAYPDSRAGRLERALEGRGR